MFSVSGFPAAIKKLALGVPGFPPLDKGEKLQGKIIF